MQALAGLFRRRPTKEQQFSDTPQLPPASCPPEQLRQWTQRLQKGHTFAWINGGKRQPCTIAIDRRGANLLVMSPKGKHLVRPTPLWTVWEIRKGASTHILQHYHEGNKSAGEHLTLAVVQRSGESINIEVEAGPHRDEVADTLAHLARQAIELHSKDPKMKAASLWEEADRNGDHKLDIEETTKLLARLNLSVNKKCFRELFQQVDVDNSGQLDEMEFMELYNKLTVRPEMIAVFERVSQQGGGQTVTVADLEAFMQTEQRETEFTTESSRRVVASWSTDACASSSMERHKFITFLTSAKHNTWANPGHRRLFQDMNQPLTHYFIASSHNTYLTGDQLQSESKCDMYSYALDRGCRCVELDCWDGPDGEPIIFHGHTATTKIKFEDVIRTINTAAFRVNPFPVILSLEVHTSLPQQDRMARIMRTIFGNKLAGPIAHTSTTWDDITPDRFKNKFLVKGKMLPPEGQEDDDTDDEEDKEGMPEEVVAKQAQEKKAAEGLKKKISAELSSCVFLKSSHFGGVLACKEKGRVWDIYSHSESKANKHLKDDLEGFADCNKVTFSRIYPKGTRVGSDNYPPSAYWRAGCQVVALNYQTMDYPLRVNEAFFTTNGKCGYVLKPQLLRVPDGRLQPDPVRLTVRVLSGAHIPRPKMEKSGEVIDPYVVVCVAGAPEDDCTESPQKTAVVNDNGFNPFWDEEFTFTVQHPALAVLSLRVLDSDVGDDDEIAEASVPVPSLRQGYRVVPLCNIVNNVAIAEASLFCHFRVDSLP